MLNCFQQRIRLGKVPESIERIKEGEKEEKKIKQTTIKVIERPFQKYNARY